MPNTEIPSRIKEQLVKTQQERKDLKITVELLMKTSLERERILKSLKKNSVKTATDLKKFTLR